MAAKQANKIKDQLATQNKKNGKSNGQKAVAPVKNYLDHPSIQKRFKEILQNRAPQFISSIVNLVNSEKALQNAEPMSVIKSAIVAATLDLPINKSLGYMWIVPYNRVAQPQIGYKGFIQLALRTGQYKSINATPVYEGELKKWNRLTEEFEFDPEGKESDKIIGYAGYFELVNGFKKTVYWTKDEIERHRKRFSKSNFGWDNDYDAMALKTVIRNMLGKWGIMSVEMRKAYVGDEDADQVEENNEFIDVEAEDVLEHEEPGDGSETDEANSGNDDQVTFFENESRDQ